MIRKRNKKNVGEPVTLNGLFKELNELLSSDMFMAREDDPKIGDIKSMLNSLTNGEACFEESDEPEEELKKIDEMKTTDSIELPTNCGGIVAYDRLCDAVLPAEQILVKDMVADAIPAIAFVTSQDMLSGVVDTICSMKTPIIIAAEVVNNDKRLITKAYVACGKTREKFIEQYGSINGFSFGDKGGIRRISVSKRDGYDFVIGENAETRFIIFDESVCPATIPTDIVSDDRKWGKRMGSEIPKMIEKQLEENKAIELDDTDKVTTNKTALCNLPETCAFEKTPHEIKKPIIGDIMKDFADAKGSGKVKDDTFVEFMKPENKEAVANAVTSSLTERTKPHDEIEPSDDEAFANDVMNAFTNSSYSERWERDSDEEEEAEVEVEDTNPDCFRCVVDYMAKEGVDSIHFWTDQDGRIHCDVQIKTIYEPEPTNPNE